MMSLTLITVGRLGEKHWTDASDEYLKRLGAFCEPEIIEIPESRLPKKPSEGEILQALTSEGKAILSRIPPRAYVFSLCIEGKTLTSEALAIKFSDILLMSQRPVFVIGGSHGLSDEVKTVSGMKLSMSGMTFPHQLARIMLLEQIYRAFTINAGMPYHK